MNLNKRAKGMISTKFEFFATFCSGLVGLNVRTDGRTDGHAAAVRKRP